MSNIVSDFDPRLPLPVGYKLLVEVPALEDQSDLHKRAHEVGLVIAGDESHREEIATVVVRVLALGPDAYQDRTRFSQPWCKPGDYVVLRNYSGTRFRDTETGREYRFVADDAIEGVTLAPNAITRA